MPDRHVFSRVPAHAVKRKAAQSKQQIQINISRSESQTRTFTKQGVLTTKLFMSRQGTVGRPQCIRAGIYMHSFLSVPPRCKQPRCTAVCTSRCSRGGKGRGCRSQRGRCRGRGLGLPEGVDAGSSNLISDLRPGFCAARHFSSGGEVRLRVVVHKGGHHGVVKDVEDLREVEVRDMRAVFAAVR